MFSPINDMKNEIRKKLNKSVEVDDGHKMHGIMTGCYLYETDTTPFR